MTFEQFDKKRRFYFICCLIATFIGGMGYTWSVVQAPFIRQLGGAEVTATVVLCYTVTVASSCMTPSVFGALIKKLGPKKTVLLGGLLFGTGYIVSGFAVNMAMFFIFYGLFTGIGAGMITPTFMGYNAMMFPEKRGVISGAIAAGNGGAAIIWSPVLANMIESRGLSFALLVAGIVSIVVVTICALLIQPVPEGYIEYKSAGMTSAGGSAAVGSGREYTRGQMVKTGLFYIALAAFTLGCTSGMMVISQVSAIMQKSFEMTATAAALYVSVCSLASTAGRFLWGTVTDHFNKYVTLAIICGIPVLTMSLAASVPGLAAAVACFAVTALCYGGFASTISPITADLFGAKHVAENYGVMYLCFAFAGLLGPQLGVRLADGADYSRAYLVAAVLSAVALVMALLVRRSVSGRRSRLCAEQHDGPGRNVEHVS